MQGPPKHGSQSRVSGNDHGHPGSALRNQLEEADDRSKQRKSRHNITDIIHSKLQTLILRFLSNKLTSSFY